MNKKIFGSIFVILFLAFIISYIALSSGYYEYELQHRMVLTSEAMKKFEEDVEEGKDVSLEEYVIPNSKDYITSLTNGTNKVALSVNDILKKGIEKFFKVIGNFVED